MSENRENWVSLENTAQYLGIKKETLKSTSAFAAQHSTHSATTTRLTNSLRITERSRVIWTA